MLTVLPRGKLSKWSISLSVAMLLLLFLGEPLSRLLYKSVPAGDNIWQDFQTRPVLASTMVLGIICGLFAFVTSLIALIKQKERALLIYVPLVLGLLLTLLLLGEFIFPH